jgi:hypothetical protein
MLGNGHVRFGRRTAETDQSKDRHRAAARPHTHWQLADGREAEILNILDDHSPAAGGIHCPQHLQSRRRRGRSARRDRPTRPPRTAAHRQWCGLHRPLPRPRLGRPRTRNRRPRHRSDPLPALSPDYQRQGGAAAPDPQELARRQARPTSIAALQSQLDLFTAYYNQQRPHRGINRQTPAAAWTARPRAVPSRQGIQISEHFRVRKDRIDTDGKLTLRHNSRLHHIGIGRNHAGTRVPMLIRERNIRIITKTPANSSANSNSTPPATTNPPAATATAAGAANPPRCPL